MKASDMIKALRANSVSEIASILEKGEQDFNEQQAQSAQQQQEYEDAKIEREALEKQKDRDHDVTITQMKIQGDLLGKELTGVGFEASSNEGDQFDKIKAAGDNALKQLDISTKQATEREKTQSSERQSNEANRLKEKEIESKERMNKDNNKTALKNKVTGEK